MKRRTTLGGLVLAFSLVVASCGGDAGSDTTAVRESAAPTPSSTTTTVEPGVTTTAVVPTTVAPEDPGISLTAYQVEMVGLQQELPIMLDFAVEAHDAWDEEEARLAQSDRAQLYRETERKFAILVGWSEELARRVAAFDALHHDDTGYADLVSGSQRLSDAAEAMLAGLRLPQSAEDDPGAARRGGMSAVRTAIGAIEDMALAAIGEDLQLSAYETAVIEMRLSVAGLAHNAEVVNDGWDSGSIGYHRSAWELGNLATNVHGLAAAMEGVEPPPERASAYGSAETACESLEAAADGMLAGLRLPRSAEEVPGTARLAALDDFRGYAADFDRVAAAALGSPGANWGPLPFAPAPRTSSPDAEPPVLAVTSPVFGAFLVDGDVVVMGSTEPGAFVTVAGTAADVATDGSWSVRVDLKPGENDVQVAAVDPAGNSTIVIHEMSRGYLFGADRIGPVRGGDAPDAVIAQFSAIFGEPDYDWIDPEPYGLPGGYWAIDYYRYVTWEDGGLIAIFTDGGYFGAEGDPQLISWYTTNPLFVTDAGIHVGSTYGEVKDAYGWRVTLETADECAPPGTFYVDVDSVGYLAGWVSGPPYNESSVVIQLVGGAGSTC